MVLLRQDVVPQNFPGAPATSQIVSQNGQGQILIRFPQHFRLLIVSENEAIIEVAPDAPMVEIEGYLLSFIAGAILHRRRALPLHASSVVVRGQAIVISGHSGRGKSTLATALTCAGHTLLSDDVTVIRFDARGQAWAVPGSPHPRLNADSIEANAIGHAQLGDGRFEDGKKIWYREPDCFDPVPVAALIRLEIAQEGEGPVLTRLRGAGAILPLPDLVYRFMLGRRLGAAASLAHDALRLAASVPVFRLSRPQNFAALGETAELALAAGIPGTAYSG